MLDDSLRFFSTCNGAEPHALVTRYRLLPLAIIFAQQMRGMAQSLIDAGVLDSGVRFISGVSAGCCRGRLPKGPRFCLGR